MLSFRSFVKQDTHLEECLKYIDLLELQESKTPPKEMPKAEEGKVPNNTKGVLHEILTGHHLNGGKHMTRHVNEFGETPEQTHERYKASIHPNDYAKINDRAKSAANHIKSFINSAYPEHKIHSVIHTSKPGDTQKVTGVKATQKQDSSDIYVTTKHPETGEEIHHGISLKVSDKTKNVPAASLGKESSGEAAKSLHDEHRKAILRDYPELQKKSDNQRKEILKNNEDMERDIKTRNKSLLNRIAHSHAAELQHHLDSGNHKHVISHIRDVLAAKSTPAQNSGNATFMRHTTHQTKTATNHHISDPSIDHEHILADHKNITVDSKGGSVNFYHKGNLFASQAHKFSSQSDPLSSLASSGRSV